MRVQVTSVAIYRSPAVILVFMWLQVAVITLGAHGLVYLSATGRVELVAAERVQAVDTTGAGDAFVGALAFYLSRFSLLPDADGTVKAARASTSSASSSVSTVGATGSALTLREVLRRAAFVATQSVTRAGSQTSSMRGELPDALFQ